MKYLLLVVLLSGCVFDDPYLARELGRAVVRQASQP